MLRVRKWIAATALSGGLALGVAAPVALSSPAGAQPVFTGGLVNVTITNLLNNNTVQVGAQIPIEVAANICGVDVSVLSNQFLSGPVATCETRQGNQMLSLTQVA
jgi:hypothetical protein